MGAAGETISRCTRRLARARPTCVHLATLPPAPPLRSGIPEKDIRGFRNPYLTTAPATRQVMPGPSQQRRGVWRRRLAAATSRLPCAASSPPTPALPPPTVAQVLHEAGFLYDSTLIEGKGYSLSNGAKERVWPCEPGASAQRGGRALAGLGAAARGVLQSSVLCE